MMFLSHQRLTTLTKSYLRPRRRLTTSPRVIVILCTPIFDADEKYVRMGACATSFFSVPNCTMNCFLSFFLVSSGKWSLFVPYFRRPFCAKIQCVVFFFDTPSVKVSVILCHVPILFVTTKNKSSSRAYMFVVCAKRPCVCECVPLSPHTEISVGGGHYIFS